MMSPLSVVPVELHFSGLLSLVEERLLRNCQEDFPGVLEMMFAHSIVSVGFRFCELLSLFEELLL